MSRSSSLSRSSIALACHDERAVLLDVDQINLDVLAVHVGADEVDKQLVVVQEVENL